MSRHVVPAIVFVTLTIMFGSSYLAHLRDTTLRRNPLPGTQIARHTDVRTIPQAAPPK